MSLSTNTGQRVDSQMPPFDECDDDQHVLAPGSPYDARARRYRQTSRRRRSKSTTQSCSSLHSASDHPIANERERSVPNVNFYVPADHSVAPRVNLNLSLGSMGIHDQLDSQFGSVTTGTPKDLETGSSDPTKQQGFGASLRFVLTKLNSWRQCHKSNGRQTSVAHSVGPTPDKAPSQSTSSRILRAFSFVGKKSNVRFAKLVACMKMNFWFASSKQRSEWQQSQGKGKNNIWFILL